MTETEFRVKHSELIEYYQLIELKLKGICAAILADEENDWYERFTDQEADPMGMLIQKVRKLQADNELNLFTEDDFKKLDDIRTARNYWAHQCFVGNAPVTFFKGNVKRTAIVKKVNADMDDALHGMKYL